MGVSIGEQRGTQGCVTVSGGSGNLATKEAVGSPITKQSDKGGNVPHYSYWL